YVYSLGICSILFFCTLLSAGTAITENHALSLHDALPIFRRRRRTGGSPASPSGRCPCSATKYFFGRRATSRRRCRSRANSCSSRSEEHTSELQSPYDLVCRLLLEKKKESIPSTVRNHWSV